MQYGPFGAIDAPSCLIRVTGGAWDGLRISWSGGSLPKECHVVEQIPGHIILLRCDSKPSRDQYIQSPPIYLRTRHDFECAEPWVAYEMLFP